VKALFAIIVRDVRLAWGQGAALPIAFFVLVAALFPFGVGPDSATLARTGGGVIWIAALLAALLPVDRLIAPDVEGGVLDQLTLRGVSEEWMALAKLIAHWLSFGPPLMIATLPASALLRLDGDTLIGLELGLLLGTPGLAALGVLVAGVTAGLRRSGALAGILMLPLAIPLLIFGAGSLRGGSNGLPLLAAVSLFLVAMTPLAAGAAIRAGRE
jgi:heme exporter protein B